MDPPSAWWISKKWTHLLFHSTLRDFGGIQLQTLGMPFKQAGKIAGIGIFEGRSTSEIMPLLVDAEEKSLEHREELYKAGDEAQSFAVVVQGALKLVKSSPVGDDIIVFFATPGVAVAALLMSKDPSFYPVSVIAMGPTVVLKIPRRTYTEVWLKDLAILQKVNSMLFSRMSDWHEQKMLTKAPLSRKVASQLVSLIERYGGDAGTILPIPITRQEIADAVGATVESVIRVMSDWSQQGFIKTTGQQIEVLRMNKILEMLKGDAEA